MNEYAIIIETENLSLADQDGLLQTLASIEKAIARVREPASVLLFNSGEIDTAMADDVRQRFPRVTMQSVAAGTGYYEVKLLGAQAVSTDIVVFADSDCRYGERWLEGLLAPIDDDPAVNVVAGETGFVGPGPYPLALSLVHAFDGFSRREASYPVNYYYANNVAFRRRLLLEHPIPTGLPLYRSGCYRHAVELRKRGETLWAQPLSRAIHAPPEGLSHFFWRFLLFGRDRTVRRRLGLDDDAPRVKNEVRGARHYITRRLGNALAWQPGQWVWLPVALPIALAAKMLHLTGRIVASFSMDRFIGYFSAIENTQYTTVQQFLDRRELSAGSGEAEQH